MTIIYKIETGEIITASEHPMPENVIEVMLRPGGRDVIDGFCEIDDYYVKEGVLTARPEKPDNSYVFDFSTGQWYLPEDRLLQEVLYKRQRLLLDSDWTQLPDVPLADKEAWAVYRQELRDITSQPNFPNDIIWPTPPTEGA